MEFRSLTGYLKNNPDSVQADVERHWEVRTHDTFDYGILPNVHAYKRCGLSISEAWYGVSYYPDGHVYAWMRWVKH